MESIIQKRSHNSANFAGEHSSLNLASSGLIREARVKLRLHIPPSIRSAPHTTTSHNAATTDAPFTSESLAYTSGVVAVASG